VSFTAPTPVDGPNPVIVALEAPGVQRRLTVAFRIILAIPHLLLLSVVGIAVLVMAFIGWFAALFTGRLPDGIASFLTNMLQYGARVIAYGQFLLTDRFPRFSFGDEDYPVEVHAAPGRLNRLAVLFRFILLIPAVIVSTLVVGGAYVGLFVTWLILVITGRMPPMLFEALAAVFRYQTRLYGYWLMLTSTYPGGLFGDRPEVTPAYPQPAPAAEPLPPRLAELLGEPVAPPPASDEPVAPPASFDEPPGFLTGRPKITRLVLSAGAKRLIVVFMVLGLVTNGASIAVQLGQAQDIATANELIDDQNELTGAANQFGQETVACGGNPECFQQASNRLADAMAIFIGQLDDANIPADAEAEATRLRDLAVQVETGLRAGPQAELQSLLFAFDAAFADLIDALAG
jgi:hypothetical protein